MGEILEDRVDSIRRQVDDTYETVALGLTAEALSHEVFSIADHLAQRAKAARTRLRKTGIRGPRTRADERAKKLVRG